MTHAHPKAHTAPRPGPAVARTAGPVAARRHGRRPQPRVFQRSAHRPRG